MIVLDSRAEELFKAHSGPLQSKLVGASHFRPTIDIKHQQSTVAAASGVHAYSNWNSTWPWVGWRLSANQFKHPTPMTFKYARLVHITNPPANVAKTSQNQYTVAGQIANIFTQL